MEIKTNVLVRAIVSHSIRSHGPQVTNNHAPRTQPTQYTQEDRNTKRRFPFTSAPSVNVLSEDPRSSMSILKSFLTDECIQNILDSANRYAEILVENPHIQARMNNN